MSNFHSKKHLRYFNLNVFPTYCSAPFRKFRKPSSYPFQAIPSAIFDFDLNLLSNIPYLSNSSSGSPSKCNIDFNSFLKHLKYSGSSSRTPSKCNVDSFSYLNNRSLISSSCWSLTTSGFGSDSSCRFCSSSYIGLSRCFSVHSHAETMIHNEKSESKTMMIAGSIEPRRNNNEIHNHAIDEVTQIIEIIRSDGEDFRSKLSSMAPALDSKKILRDTFRVLNQLRMSGLNFFRILVDMNPKLHRSSDVCSLIINNCGWLSDYKSMASLLEEFKLENICLTQMAFEFLPISGPNMNHLMESIRGVIDVLNKVGGSCRNSGVTALIERFCSSSSFQMAKFIIEITERKVQRYNILIRARCRQGQVEEAQAIIEEMLELGCLPDTNTYNSLIAYLCKRNRMGEACKVLDRMTERGSHPDRITFEALIYHSSIRGKMDVASQYLDLMVHMNIEPRPATHSAFLKALFQTKDHKKAYKYVNDMVAKFKTSSNTLYNLLAKLHLQNGDSITAKNIFDEMIEKGLRPKPSIYLQCEPSNKEGHG